MRKKKWKIGGMSCPHCEKCIEEAAGKLKGLQDPHADYKKGTLTAVVEEEIFREDLLAKEVKEAGYFLEQNQNLLPGGLVFLLGLGFFLLFAYSPVESLFQSVPLARAGMSLGALFLLGFLTSFHCVGMCGGLMLASFREGHAFRDGLTYNIGRLFSYMIVGSLVGALGSVFRLSTKVQGCIQLLAAAFLLLRSCGMLGLRVLGPLPLPFLGGGLLSGIRGRRSALMIGLLNALMPCGPLQAMQIYALTTGSWYMGALSMAAFALGSFPLMWMFGLLGARVQKGSARTMRMASAVLLLVMGTAMLSRGLSLTGMTPRLLQTKPQEEAVKAGRTGEAGEEIQYITSELDWRGYPDITVKAGVPVSWVIHADQEKLTGCNQEMVFPALDLRVLLSPGDNEISFTVEEPGVIPYTCWMGMLKGSITVTE